MGGGRREEGGGRKRENDEKTAQTKENRPGTGHRRQLMHYGLTAKGGGVVVG